MAPGFLYFYLYKVNMQLIAFLGNNIEKEMNLWHIF